MCFTVDSDLVGRVAVVRLRGACVGRCLCFVCFYYLCGLVSVGAMIYDVILITLTLIF